MSSKIILIVIGLMNPLEMEAFQYYKTSINEIYEEVGATVQGRYPVIQTVIGETKPDFVLVVEFPDEEAFIELFSSKEYIELVPYREKGFKDLTVYISKNQ